jgi:hypothetical protein
MATLLKVLDNLADIKSAGGVALGLGTQGGALQMSYMRDFAALVAARLRDDGCARSQRKAG